MKAYIIVMVILLFYFCLPTHSFGYGRNESPPISYVAGKKKQASESVSQDKKLSFVDSRKKSSVEPVAPKKNSFVADYRQMQFPSSSYVGQMKQQKGYRQKEPIIAFPGKMVSRVVTISRPLLKRVWNKACPSRKSVRSSVNFETDLSFDVDHYQSIASWAEREGKTYQAKQVTAKYGEIIKALSIECGVDYRVIIAICAHESGGDPSLVSYAGASGLMQLMPNTAAAYGVYGDAIFDPYQNLRAGTYYFSDMVKMFGNVKDALYAYGWGHARARYRIKQGIESDEVTGVQQVLYLAQLQ